MYRRIWFCGKALPQILENKPDVVLMDIKLPRMSGIECVAEIKKVAPTTQIIMVTVYEDSERIFCALKAGANGYLVKSGPPDQLLEAIRGCSCGRLADVESHRAQSSGSFSFAWTIAQGSRNLSPRERESH
ncbi:MAG: response regulator transcription factor [Limisphaerales bacterium]